MCNYHANVIYHIVESKLIDALYFRRLWIGVYIYIII